LVRSFVLLLCGPLLFASPMHVVGQADASRHPANSDPVYLVIRSDDAGMSHSVNMALERLIATGLPVSISVMFPTPWYQETVDILKRHPEVSVGIHLTLNSEWKRSQIDRARGSGLKIDYVDYHMGTAVRYPEFREITERLAKEYGLGMSQYFGETRHDPQYSAAPRDKTDSLVTMVNRLKPRFNLVVTHVGIDDAELGALLDMNTSGPLPDMSKNRQGELDALTSQRFGEAIKARNVRLITYRQVIEMQGLKSMRRPEDN